MMFHVCFTGNAVLSSFGNRIESPKRQDGANADRGDDRHKHDDGVGVAHAALPFVASMLQAGQK